MEIGEKIRQIRIKKGLTQKDLAKRLYVSQSYIANYENGNRKPKIETLQRIAAALDVPIDTFLEVQTFDTPEDFHAAWDRVTQAGRDYEQIKNGLQQLNAAGIAEASHLIELLTQVPAFKK